MRITKKWNLSIRPEILARLQRLSSSTGRTMSWYVVRGLVMYVFPTYEREAEGASDAE